MKKSVSRIVNATLLAILCVAVVYVFRQSLLNRAYDMLKGSQVVQELTHQLNEEIRARGKRFDRERYIEMVTHTVEESKRRQSSAILIDKGEYRLYILADGKLEASFPIELGTNPTDDKIMEGDRCTPEGCYKVTAVKKVGDTRFYKALLLNYPNSEDMQRFKQLQKQGKIPPSSRPGNLIEIHGDGSGLGRYGLNWTLGCIALSNKDMDALFRHKVSVGTPVTIVRYGAAAIMGEEAISGS